MQLRRLSPMLVLFLGGCLFGNNAGESKTNSDLQDADGARNDAGDAGADDLGGVNDTDAGPDEVGNPSDDAVCGDSIVEGEEACDDGTQTATCDGDCTLPTCGDGVHNAPAGEECDSGGEATADCDPDCTRPVCGDLTLNTVAGEECDDGGETPNCDNDCTAVICGDQTVNTEAGEACDDGGDSLTCDEDCSVPLCGDGHVNVAAGEECEDGNTVDNDFCDNECQGTGYRPCPNETDAECGALAGAICGSVFSGTSGSIGTVCYLECTTAADCPPAYGGTAVSECRQAGNTRQCTLSCANDLTCPDGMTCSGGDFCYWPE